MTNLNLNPRKSFEMRWAHSDCELVMKEMDRRRISGALLARSETGAGCCACSRCHTKDKAPFLSSGLVSNNIARPQRTVCTTFVCRPCTSE